MKDIAGKRVKVVYTIASNLVIGSQAEINEQGIVHTIYPEHTHPICVVFGDGYVECFKEEELRYINNRRIVL